MLQNDLLKPAPLRSPCRRTRGACAILAQAVRHPRCRSDVAATWSTFACQGDPRWGVRISAIFLASIGGVDDQMRGLEVGADDHLVKPFSFSGFLARVNALARRPPVREQKTVLGAADLEADLKRSVVRGGQEFDLQAREFLLLEYEGRVRIRAMPLERVWGFRFDPKTSVLKTPISGLRAKIDKPLTLQLLHTVRNTGYSLHAPR